MKATFLDTSGLIAVVNTDDQWHELAIKSWQTLLASSLTLVTSSLVIVEIADGLSRIRHRPLAIQIIDSLCASSRVQIVESNAELEHHAWELHKSRMDKEWGMTDCVSMLLMQDLGITDVFSVDADFAQAGFNLSIS